MSSIIRGKTEVVVAAQQLSAGTAKHLTGGAQASFMGGTFTEAEITSKLQMLVTLRSDVDNAKAAAKAKLALENATAPPLIAFMNAYVAYVRVTFGAAPDVLADFGIHPKARAQPSVATKAGAVAKREATRAARHTMGSQQKKEVRGDVSGVTVTPVHAAPTVPAPPASPAPATSGSEPPATPRGAS